MLYLASLGLALHLILPQIPGIKRSLILISESSVPLILMALLAFMVSQACYAELFGRSAGAAVGSVAYARRRRRGLGRRFMLRLTLVEHGAARILPGGGSSAATVTYTALRSRGLSLARIGLTVATITSLVYGTLGIIFLACLLYLTLNNELSWTATTASLLVFGLAVCLIFLGYLAYLWPRTARRLLTGFFYSSGRLFAREWSHKRTELWAARIVLNLQVEVRTLREQLVGHPLAALKLGALALGYWGFDALCLAIIFLAFGVDVDVAHLLVAYGIAAALGALPITPGGLGVFETTMLGTLALLGAGPEVAIPVLGYRLFNFWLPIPMALILYPTLHIGASRYAVKPRDRPPRVARAKLQGLRGQEGHPDATVPAHQRSDALDGRPSQGPGR